MSWHLCVCVFFFPLLVRTTYCECNTCQLLFSFFFFLDACHFTVFHTEVCTFTFFFFSHTVVYLHPAISLPLPQPHHTTAPRECRCRRYTSSYPVYLFDLVAHFLEIVGKKKKTEQRLCIYACIRACIYVYIYTYIYYTRALAQHLNTAVFFFFPLSFFFFIV